MNSNPIKAVVVKEALREGYTTKLVGRIIYVWSQEPNMWYNSSDVVVSLVANGNGKFTMPTECLKAA